MHHASGPAIRCAASRKQTHLIYTLWTLVAGFTPFFTSFAALSQ